MLDIFNGDAFSVTTLTDTINKLKYVAGRIGQMGLFNETGVATTSVAMEEKDGVLKMIGPTPRGGPGRTVAKPNRTARSLGVPHFEINDAVMAEEVQGIRAWGTTDITETIQSLVADRLQIHSQSMSQTQEFARMGALMGLVRYADEDGAITSVGELDLFSFFQVSQSNTFFFDFDGLVTADAATGDIRRICGEIVRETASVLGGVPFTGLYAFAGDSFYDKLVQSPEVRNTYLGWLGAAEIRGGSVNPATPGSFSFGAFPYGGIMWENYRGFVGSDPFVPTDQAIVFPVGVPGLYRTYYAPADYIETVNTIGQRMYAKQYEMDNGKGVNLDSQMNSLDVCLRPNALMLCDEADM